MVKKNIQQLDINLLQQIGNLELIARYVVEGFITGLHKSPFHGFSVEFAEHRQYNQGETIRHIDWKLYGRTDKLYVKKYEEETNLRCQIIIDTSSSMNYPQQGVSKLNFSLMAAAALINLLKNQRDAAGITFFSNQIESHHQARSSHAHLQILYNLLQNRFNIQQEQKTTSASKALHSIAETIHKRSLVIIFSDMFDNNIHEKEYISGLQHLRFKKHEIILFHVTDKLTELDFNFENRLYRFTDLETGEKVDIFPDEYREKYLLEMNKYISDLKVKCSQYQIDFVEADIKQGFNHVLQNYLLKRQRLF